MAFLSNNAQRALEQVKNGLLVLYGADYFTDAEWVRIDHIIHKGNYVFTSGPSTHMLDEPLMSFGEPKQENPLPIENCENKEKDTIIIMGEKQTEPTSSNMMDTSNSESDPATFLSADNSADGKTPPFPSRITTPALSEPAKRPVLPTGYTQEQLEESKAFRSDVKIKANHYSKPQSSSWDTNAIDQADLESPLPTEALVSSWASGVHEAGDVASLQNSTSTLALQDGTSKTPRPSSISSTRTPLIEIYYKQFLDKYGRAPSSLGDYWQPNNPEYKGPNPPTTPKYARSVTSTASVPRKKILSSGTSGFQPHSKSLNGSQSEQIVIGAMYIATHTQIKTSKIQLEANVGDCLQVMNLVSGITYVCQNIQTGERGQFKATMLRLLDTPANQVAGKGWVGERAHARNNVPSIDMIETLNAAEWDEDPASRTKTPSGWNSVTRRGSRAMPLPPTGPAAPRPEFPASLSRFSVLADEGGNANVTPAMQAAIDMGIRKSLGNEMDRIRETLSPNLNPFDSANSRSNKSRKESGPAIVPKTNTCWFWATNKGCRFTAEECRDLHSHTNPLGEPTNFHNGKPTWGAAADYSRPSPSINDGGFEGDPKKFTCWFWANKGKCVHSDQDCKYSHEQTAGGVARPGAWKQPVRDSWRRAGETLMTSWRATPETTAENGTWGEEKESSVAPGDDWGTGQPDHVRDLESRLQQEEIGW